MRHWTAAGIASISLAFLTLPALADPPDDIVDLVGARAPGAESQMQARGYVDAQGNNIWWKQATGICVKVHVSGGHYQTIDTVAPLDCGIKDFDASEADAPRSVSKAAMDACMNAADELQSEEPGTSTVKNKKHSGENWVLTMNTLGRTSHCTVTQGGDVIGMDPP